MQLDFFNDSHNLALRNDVILALEQADAPAAQRAWDTLGQRHPHDDCLVDLRLLIVVLAERRTTPLRDHGELCVERQKMQDQITPAAHHSLGSTQASQWLRQRWRELAHRAGALRFRTDLPDDHAALLWLNACDWQASVEAVNHIASWRRIPAPLSWMLHARLRLQGLQANWGLLAELAWMAPQRLESVVQQSAEPVLQTLIRKFEDRFEGVGDASDLAWFPAWVLTERPSLASALTQAQPAQYTAPEQALRVLLELLGLERQGRQREVIEQRKTLRGLHTALYAGYMATR